MRILLVADPLIPVPPVLYGGIERIVAGLIDELRSRGHAVGLLALGESTAPADSRFSWPSRRVDRAIHTVRNALALRRACRAFRADVVHSFARLAYLAPLLSSGLPKIMSYQRPPGARPVRLAARFAAPGSLVFTGCSAHIAELGRRHGGEWRAIPNFAPTETLRPDPAPPAPGAPLVFLSRLDRVKAPRLAIEIARRAGVPLVLAGNRAESGPDAEYFEREVAPLLGDDARWIGPVNDEEKRRLLAGARAMLVPIQWDEPFGIVFAEALACGCPVIASPRGALPEIVDEGKTGYLVNTLEQGVRAVHALPRLSRAACRAAAETRFSPSAVADRYVALYADLVARHR